MSNLMVRHRRSVAMCSMLLMIMAVLAWGASVSDAEPIVGVTSTNVLLFFDSATPGTTSSVTVTGLVGGDKILAIDRRPVNGALYALGSGSRLYSINTATGAATQVGSDGAFTLSGTAFGFDFNPTVDRIRVTSNIGQDLRLNPNDGTLTATDIALAYGAADVNFGRAPSVVGSAYTNNFSGAATTTLFDIDSGLDLLAIQNPPNNGTLNTVGALGFNTSNLVGFDISGLSALAFASLTSPTGSASQLFTVNLGTGAATLVGTIGSGFLVSDIAVSVASPAVP